MKSDIQFLKDLQLELNNQSNDSQASPRFWVVGDYIWESCWEENAEEFEIYIPNDGTSYKWEEFKAEELTNNNYELSRDATLELCEIEDVDTFLEWVHEHIDTNSYLVPVIKNHIIRPNTMFLTKEEAKRHIELNHYHYTSEAHTYAMTAWRAPKVERLLKILSEFDFDALKN